MSGDPPYVAQVAGIAVGGFLAGLSCAGAVVLVGGPPRLAVAFFSLAVGWVAGVLAVFFGLVVTEGPPPFEPRDQAGVPYSQWSADRRAEFDQRIWEAETQEGRHEDRG